MRDYIYFSNKNISDFGTFITNAGVYATPVRGYESIPVEGRNGNVIFDKDNYENIEYRYPSAIPKDFDKNYTALRAFMLSNRGYKRLSDTFNPDEFYMATFARFDAVRQPYLNGDMGSFDMIFERKPQRYLKSGEKKFTFTSNGSLKNPTQFRALPLITVYGNGKLTIGDISIDIDTEYAHLDIDCELQEVLQTEGNLDVTLDNGEFPKLEVGVNNISFTGLTKVEITPRWWTL